MILKRMDETILAGQYDLEEDAEGEVTVVLVEPQLNLKPEEQTVIDWHSVGQGPVSKAVLYYDDTADPSNTYIKSWQDFYNSGDLLNENPPFSGCSSLFKNGLTCFGGITKAAAYMRYSKGFEIYLQSFDSEAAKLLISERSLFEKKLVQEQNKAPKLPQKWLGKFTPGKGLWTLPVLAKLSSGKNLVLGLKPDFDRTLFLEDLDDLKIDVEHSQELMNFLRKPVTSEREMLIDLFQMGSGLGRNPFGKTCTDNGQAETEYNRLMGCVPESSRAQILDFWKNRSEYRIKFAPNPDRSSLIFLPEIGFEYSELKKHIDNENRRRDLYFAAKKKQQRGNEDCETLKVQRPVLPVDRHADIFLVNVEGSQKQKVIIQQLVPSVSVRYFSALNEELLTGNLQYTLVQYMKYALTGQDAGDTPSVYAYWTDIFTKALQKQYISARPAYENYQQFAGNLPGKKLIDEKVAASYWRVIGKMLRLANLIRIAREAPERLGTMDLATELSAIETFKIKPKQGVFGKMTTANVPSGSEILGESYSLLRERERQKFDNFIRQAYYGVPDEDFNIFARGALTGMLLQNLCWCITNEGRRFSVTQGRHPSRLRGMEITSLFVKGIGLLQNLDKVQLFNGRMLPFIKSVEAESLRDSFNSGMIMGMVYFEPKEEKQPSGPVSEESESQKKPQEQTLL